jgi:hypothetical protein
VVSYLKLLVVIVILLVYVSITVMVMRFVYPEMSETELFLSIPRAFILNFG